MTKKSIESDRRHKIEQARRKERAAERRRTMFSIVGAVVLGGGLVAAAVLLDDSKKAPDETLAPLETIGVSEADAGCAAVANKDKIPEGGTHKAGRIDYPDSPPDSGIHNQKTLTAKFYSRDDKPMIEQAVHDLEHGVVIAWYDAKLPDDQVKFLQDAVGAHAKAAQEATPRPKLPRLVAVPWDRGDFPDDKHLVLTAWGHRQACGQVSGAVLANFVQTYADKDAPEKNTAV